MLAKGSQRPLVAEVVLLGVLVLNESFILLIDRVIGQVHVLVVLVDLLGVGFGGETSKTLLENVDSQRFIAGNQHVDAQIKLMTIDQQGVRDVLRNDAGLVNVNVVDVVHDIDASTLACVRRLHNPNVLLALMLLELLIVVVEVAKLIG